MAPQERESGLVSMCDLVTSILLHCTKIMVHFSLPAGRPQCRVILSISSEYACMAGTLHEAILDASEHQQKV